MIQASLALCCSVRVLPCAQRRPPCARSRPDVRRSYRAGPGPTLVQARDARCVVPGSAPLDALLR